MTKNEYIKTVEKLNEYTRLYDMGTPAISDEEWDKMYFDIVDYEKTNEAIPESPTVGISFTVMNELTKVKHNHLMLSLDKTQSVSDLIKWIDNRDTVVMHKLDGLTCSLKYENGKLVGAETRGDGETGEDVLHNAKVVSNIPQTISTKDTLIVDGEVICTYADFEEFASEYKNPRNFASGSIRLLDANESAKRKLSFVAWDIIDSKNATFVEDLEDLKKYGFTVVDYQETSDNIEKQQEEMKDLAVDKSYPIDGLVYRVINNKDWANCGRTEHHFQGSFAFKFSNVYYNTNLIDIDWSVGKTGLVTPIAIFEPVVINGATIQKASLHNLSIMEEVLGEKPYKGQPVQVCLANEIIPQLKRIS